LSLCLAEFLAALFRDSISELATLPPGESVVFCLLAGGELAEDEPKSNGVCFFGVVGCEGVCDEVCDEVRDEVRDDPLEL
jgi:hypothetical protein